MKEVTRKKIVDVASELFAKYGFHKTSVDQISKTARKAKGSLYYHFSSKEELFTEVVAQEFMKVREAITEVVENDKLNPVEKLKLFLLARNQTLAKSGNYQETIRADLFERFEFLDKVRQEQDKWEKDMLENILREGYEKGYFTDLGDIRVLVDVFYLVLKGLEIPFFVQNLYQKLSSNLEDLVGIIFRGLSANPQSLISNKASNLAKNE